MGHACGKPRENQSIFQDVVIDISSIEKGELYKDSQLLNSEDLTKILESSRITLRTNDNSYSAHLNQGICSYFLGYSEAAESHLLKSRQLSKSFESSYILGLIYLQKNDLKQAQQFLKHSLSEVPMVFVYIRLGEVLLRRNKYEEARKFAKQGLTQFKNDAELLSIVGMSYMPSNLGKASKYCQKSIKINPNLFKPYINLGDIEKAQENYEKAEEMYRSALTKANISQKGFTQLMLSLLHFQTGDLSKAISFFKKSFKTNPNLEEIMLNKGFDLLLKNTIFQKALDQMQVENYFECQETLRPLYRKNKKSIPIIFFLGICHFHLQNMSKSRHFLRKVLKLSETSAKNEVNDLFILRSEDLISTHFTETPEPAPVDISDKPSESLDQVEEAEEELITQEGNYPNFQENLKESEAIDEEIKEIKVESSPPKLIPRTIKSNSLRQFAKSADPEPEKNCSIF